jgi:2-isopropylmalate synthase
MAYLLKQYVDIVLISRYRPHLPVRISRSASPDIVRAKSSTPHQAHPKDSAGMIEVLDTTLREGEQSPGTYFSPFARLEIAQMLDDIGVEFIEAGNPAADPEIRGAISDVARAGLRARIVAHALCRRPDVDIAIDCGVAVVGVFMSVAEKRLRHDYGMNFGQAVDRIQSVIRHAKAQGLLAVRYTPEDAVRSRFEDVVAASAAAVEAGADIVSIADTTGYMAPFGDSRNFGTYVARFKSALAAKNLRPKIAVHCHNDRGLALANALEACLIGGADIVDATVMGLGERAGVVDLAQLLVNLRELDPEAPARRLGQLPALYDEVSRFANQTVSHNLPVVGKFAFTHYAGVHVKAVSKAADLYLSLEPRDFGREWSIALGLQSGRSSMEMALRLIGRADVLDDPLLVARILAAVKDAGKTVGTDVLRDLPAIVRHCERRMRSHPSGQPSLAPNAARPSIDATPSSFDPQAPAQCRGSQGRAQSMGVNDQRE